MTITRSKIRLVHVITGLQTGGAEMMLYKLLSNIDRDKFDCQVISLTNAGVIGPKISALGVPVFIVGMRNGMPDPIGFVKLVLRLKELQPDIVQTWLYHADLLGGLAAKLTDAQKVLWNIRQSNLDAGLNKWHTRMTAKLCALFSAWLPDSIICNSEKAAQVHQALGYKKKLFYIIGNGFDLTKFQPDPGSKSSFCKQFNICEHSILVGLIARFDPQKDHHNFIRATSQVLAKFSDVRFVLVGAGIDRDNRKLLQWIKETGHSENFLLLGERNDLAEINSALDIACSSSLGEGFPNAIGEAMACGVPCIVTDVGDSAKLIGDSGWVVESANPDAFGNAIVELLSKPKSYRQQLGRKARQRIEKHYSIESIVTEYERLY